MSRPSAAKAARRKARQRRVSRRPVTSPDGGKYPRVEVDEEGAPKGFIDLFRAAKVSLGDKAVFPDWERDLFRSIKAHGPFLGEERFIARWASGVVGPKTWRELPHLQAIAVNNDDSYLDESPPVHFLRETLPYVLGHRLFEQIDKRELRRYLPLHCARVRPEYNDDNELVARVSFESLRRVPTSGGSAYYSDAGPKVEIDGKPHRVAFMHHAAQRICERFVPPWLSYVGHRFAYSMLRGVSTSYTTERLGNGEEALVLWLGSSIPATAVWRYAREVLGAQPGDNGRTFRIRAGYLPYFVHNDFLVGKTLVPPWFKQTPEMSFIRQRAMIDDGQRRQLIDMSQRAIDNTNGMALDPDTFKLLRRFQSFGFKQAERLEES